MPPFPQEFRDPKAIDEIEDNKNLPCKFLSLKSCNANEGKTFFRLQVLRSNEVKWDIKQLGSYHVCEVL